MRVISLAGSPRIPSRSAALLSLSQRWLQQQGVEVIAYTLHDFDAEDLLYANFNSPAIKAFTEQLAQATACWFLRQCIKRHSPVP